MTSKHSTDINGITGKICSHCKLWYQLTEYSNDKNNPDGLQYRCNHCIKKYRQSKQYKISNRKSSKKYGEKAYKKFKIIMDELKSNGCAICGYSRYNRLLDFHHSLSTDKKFEIGQGWGKSNKVLSDELNKCILLCRKCHMRIHRKGEIELN